MQYSKGQGTGYLSSSQYGSLPLCTVVSFTIVTVLFLLGSSVAYMIFEDWTFLDAFYFAVITMSTVGYGDVHPTSSIGKFVNIGFILVSFCGVFLFFRVVIGYLVDRQINAIIDRVKVRKKQKNKRIASSESLGTMAQDAQHEIADEDDEDLQSGKNLRWVIHLIVYLLWCVCWVLFYTLYDGEDFSFIDALYFGVVTSSTIGYGRYIPLTNGGKWFCSFSTMFGVISLGILAGSISQALLAGVRKCCVRHKHEKETERFEKLVSNLLQLPKSGGGKISKLDFITKMLIGERKCSQKDIAKLIREFDKLDRDNNGVLDINDFKQSDQQKLLSGNTANIAVHQNNEDSTDDAAIYSL